MKCAQRRTTLKKTKKLKLVETRALLFGQDAFTTPVTAYAHTIYNYYYSPH